MSPDPAARRLAGVVVAVAGLTAVAPARAGFTPVFRWNAKVNGGYTGNVFYSQGKEKVSSWGGTVRLFGSLVWKGPQSSYGGNYRTTYQNYSDGQATDLNSLSHNLTLTMNQLWTKNTQFIASAKANYTPEQNPFDEFDDPTDFLVNVHPRAQRTSVGLNAGWRIETGQGDELRTNVSWSTVYYGDPVLPPPRPGEVQKPAQPFVDQNSFKAGAVYQWSVAPKRRVDLTGSWSHQIFDQTTIQFAKIDNDGDGTIDKYKETGRTDLNGANDSITVTSGYSWEITELTRGTAGLGLLASNDQNNVTDYDVAVSMTINQELSPRSSGTFGLSRDQAAYEGIGGASIGTRAYANFEVQTSLKTKFKANTSFSRSESQQDDSRVDYLKVAMVFVHTVARWGGYNISYSYNDQKNSGDLVNVENGRTRYDIISFGLNFDPSKFVDSGGGKQK